MKIHFTPIIDKSNTTVAHREHQLDGKSYSYVSVINHYQIRLENFGCDPYPEKTNEKQLISSLGLCNNFSLRLKNYFEGDDSEVNILNVKLLKFSGILQKIEFSGSLSREMLSGLNLHLSKFTDKEISSSIFSIPLTHDETEKITRLLKTGNDSEELTVRQYEFNFS